MEQEIWKPVEGFEGLYEISNLGRVKSLWFGKEKIMNPAKTKDGYLFVNLYKDRKRKAFKVHRLVATAFIPNHEGFEQVNHKNEVKTNNCVENLEWCSAWDNMHYGTLYERSAAALINHPVLSKSVEASRFSDFREICLKFASTHEAGRNGYCQVIVSHCCLGHYCSKGNFYKNLYWRYA